MKNPKKLKVAYITVTICILIITVYFLSLFYFFGQNYLLYDYKKSEWKEIQIEYPLQRLDFSTGRSGIFVVSFDYSRSEFEKYSGDFISEFNDRFEILQITDGNEDVYYPRPLDNYNDSFLSIPQDLNYKQKVTLVIRMKEEMTHQDEIAGNIYLVEMTK